MPQTKGIGGHPTRIWLKNSDPSFDQYTPYTIFLERFSIGRDRRVFLGVVCRAVARSGRSGVPRGGSPLAGRAGYPGVPTFYLLLSGGRKRTCNSPIEQDRIGIIGSQASFS